MKPLVVVGTFATVASVGFVIWMSGKSTNTVSSGKPVPQSAGDVTGRTALKSQGPAGGTFDKAEPVVDAPAPSGDATKPGLRTLVLGEGHGGFRLNALDLSDQAVTMLDDLINGMTEEEIAGARFEIEGYTDSLGSTDVNKRIGLARAVAVKMYLCTQFEIDPRQIKLFSYGAEKPVADNATQEGRALNRRVVIKVIGQ